MRWETECNLAVAAAREAAELLTTRYAADPGTRHQKGRDIKTRADTAAEACILRHLEQTPYPVIAEESANQATLPEGLHWLVDPLDGTMNFSRRFPVYGVSIALWEKDDPVVGVVVDIARRITYRGIVGEGAWCNDHRMKVSTVADCSQAILATGLAAGGDYGTETLNRFVSQIQAFKKVRMIGSAALALALVADGTFDAYREDNIMIWDVAAGLALVRAAGGTTAAQLGNSRLSVVASATNGQFSFPA